MMSVTGVIKEEAEDLACKEAGDEEIAWVTEGRRNNSEDWDVVAGSVTARGMPNGKWNWDMGYGKR
jgi:hypothetical protein